MMILLLLLLLLLLRLLLTITLIIQLMHDLEDCGVHRADVLRGPWNELASHELADWTYKRLNYCIEVVASYTFLFRAVVASTDLQPIHEVRIHTIKNPGSRSLGTSFSLRELHTFEISIGSVRAPACPDSYSVNRAYFFDLPGSFVGSSPFEKGCAVAHCTWYSLMGRVAVVFITGCAVCNVVETGLSNGLSLHVWCITIQGSHVFCAVSDHYALLGVYSFLYTSVSDHLHWRNE